DTDASFVEGKWKEKVQLRGDRAKDQTIPSGAEVQTICIQALESMWNLVQIAPNTDDLRLPDNAAKAVAGTLWIIASHTVEALYAVANRHPEYVLPFSRDAICAPGFISHKRAFKLETAALLKKLQLGEGGVFSKREWRVLAPSTRAAFYLFAIAQKKKQDLP